VFASKRGTSAFFPGNCSLPRQLAAHDITSILIAGTVTNVCCESSARDATELGYEVTMVSDGCHGHSHGLHEASLATFFRIFGDVRPAAEVLDLIAAGDRHKMSGSGRAH
jgi:nicotinamidase-related amidase